ncbi:hypothetical protein MTR67_023137 [Solanum verrucosum]|uniref:Integrase zinc-binding domain-containing protein n=1 Tax=Solanum verrucosum TaxID=315347 RepID=A0AAF0TR51_SOLVR|nr:hypothetical protein MTR67_023137 [Solanum verrucosum]
MVEDSMEVFMDDFSIFGDSYEACLEHLGKVLQRCLKTYLVLNGEKYHFMFKEVKGIWSFLGHMGFYRRYKGFFKVCGIMPKGLNFYQQKKLLFNIKRNFLDEPYLFRECADHIIRRCISEVEVNVILDVCHASLVGGHHRGMSTTTKVLQSFYYWPSLNQDAHYLFKQFIQCQNQGGVSMMG